MLFDNHNQCLVSDIPESEWSSLQEYTARVVEFRNDPTTHTDAEGSTGPTATIGEATLFYIGQLQGATQFLFPNLRRLHITQTTYDSFPYLTLFCSTSLERIELSGISGSTSGTKMPIALFLKKVGTSHNLAELILDSICLPAEVFTAIITCKQLKHLRMRNVSSMSGRISQLELQGLFKLPLLKTLEMDLKGVQYSSDDVSRNDFWRPKEDTDVVQHAHQCLESFRFTGDFRILYHLADNLISANPKSIHIDLPNFKNESIYEAAPISTKKKNNSMSMKKSTKKMRESQTKTINPIEVFIENMATNLSGALHALTISIPNSVDMRTSEGIFFGLYNLDNITHLDIVGIPFSPQDDAPFWDLSNPPWPRIRFLRFAVRSEATALPFSTLNHIAKSYPYLESFEALINLPDPSEIPKNRACSPFDPDAEDNYAFDFDSLETLPTSTSLTRLSIGTPQSWQEHDLRMADYLFAYIYLMFPNLSRIETHYSFREVLWKQVDKFLQMYHQIVAIEQRRKSKTSIGAADAPHE